MRAGDQIFYVVVGAGTFPYDMLRYDQSFPALEEHSHRIDPDMNEFALRFVILGKTVRENGFRVEPRRWRSFGWAVVPYSMFGKEAYVNADMVPHFLSEYAAEHAIAGLSPSEAMDDAKRNSD